MEDLIAKSEIIEDALFKLELNKSIKGGNIEGNTSSMSQNLEQGDNGRWNKTKKL